MDFKSVRELFALADVEAPDLAIAADGSFVETSSGPAARELKRRFDQQVGVGPTLRSPFAITAFVNQHGKPMYRVGNRHLDPPAAKAPDAANDAPASPPRSTRRSRISMHHIFTPNVFHKSFIPPNDHLPLPRPQTASSVASGHRKLRKTRSFGPGDQDQQGFYQPQPGSANAFTGRAHSHSVTSADVSRFTPLASFVAPFNYAPASDPLPSPVPLSPPIPQVPPWGDVFAQVMQWRVPIPSYTNPSTVSFSTMGTTGTAVNSSGCSYEKSLASTGSSGRGQPDRAFVPHPFGAGVAFDSPVRKAPRIKRNDSQGSVITRDPRPVSQDSVLTQVPAASATADVDPDAALPESHYPSRLAMPPSKMLREMQSFESTMTARQIDIEPETARGTPTASISPSPWDMIDYRLLNSYDDNPNLKRPPSAVWLRNVAPSSPPGANGGQLLGESKLPETPELDTLASDTAPSTPVLAPASIADDEATTIPVNEALRAFITTHDDDNNNNMPMIPDENESESEAGPSLRYTSTPDVFDVLQTYTGLPLLDRLPAMSGKRSTNGSSRRSSGVGVGVREHSPKVVEGGQDNGDDGNDDDDDDDDDDLMVEMTVIRMSLTTKEESAAPRDDPRFVIWGWINDVAPEKKEVEDTHTKEKKTRSWRGSLLSGSEGDKSLSDRESHPKKSRLSLGSRSRSRKEKGRAAPAVNEFGVVEDVVHTQDASEDDPARVPTTSEGKKKVLIAATIERWVAQLTSEIDYDELLVFFLTYRTYVNATDLCRVLIGRFYWALRGGEEAGDTKVCDDRVRRIVRVRTFVAIRYWLIQFWPVDFVPNRELRLLMADCLNQLNRDPLLKKHVDGLGMVKRLIKAAKERRRAMLAKTAGGQASSEWSTDADDSDVDLDFLPEEHSAPSHGFKFGRERAGELLGSTGAISSGLMMGPAQARGGPLKNAAHPSRAILAQSHPQGALSRVVRTFGRWRRALNSRSASGIAPPFESATGHAPASAASEVSAFEVDTSGDRSSASIRRGVEGYPRLPAMPSALSTTTAAGESQPSLPHTLPPLSLPSLSMTMPGSDANANAVHAERESLLADGSSDVPASDASSNAENAAAESEYEAVDSGVEIGTMADTEDYSDDMEDTEAETPGRAQSLRSASTNSFGVPLSASRGPQPLFASAQSPWPFDVVSIDDLELSDSSSEKGAAPPPGLRKLVRKLPKKPLFWPRDSVSSMGIISHASMASGPSSSGMSSPTGAGLGGKIEPWQLQDLLKSLRADEEEGDGGVDAALKRLEGYIDPQKQEEKIKNVNDWITNIQKRMEAGDYDDGVNDPRYSYPGYEEELIEFDEAERDPRVGADRDPSPDTPPSPLASTPEAGLSPAPEGNTPILSQAPSLATLVSSPRVPDVKSTVDGAVPVEILQSRMPTSPLSLPLVPNFDAPLPRLHQSFIASYRAEVLAQHFAMIDGELFSCIRFEELVSAEWTACQEVNVLDWNQYLRDRAQWKAEHRFPEKTNTLAVVRARFNLMTNFVISEVILTPPSARVLVFKKFLTVAFKSYSMNNFHALAAIVTGLSHELVYKSLGRYWSRINRREHRMFTNFQKFISNVDDFKFMRNMVDLFAQAKPRDESSHTPSVVSGGTESKHKSEPSTPCACIPFIGAYLSQLHRLSQLPDLIDPTAPHLAMEIDPNTGTCCPPRYPDVFSALAPLPSFIQLEPLINVHKQRQISAVINSLIAGQQLARRVHFGIDKKLFHKCLRLRASDISVLQRVLDKYPD